jgi:hypothetical protein
VADPSGEDLGLSLRDRFAYQAMSALLSMRGTARKPAVLSRVSYDFADAMVAARGSSGPPTLRDRIAELAMNGLIASEGTGIKLAVVGRLSYELADAMLLVRTKPS